MSTIVGGTVRINAGQNAADFTDVKVGDQLDVSGNGEAGYNVKHRVLAIDPSVNPRWVETDQTFSDVGVGGEVKLDIPTAEHPAYQVIENITDTDDVFVTPAASGATAVFVNLDPLPNANIGVRRKLYVRVADAATYKMTIAASLDVSGGG